MPLRKREDTKVCVIGGGIAGLSAAVFLKNNRFDVTLVESSPRLGGRAYSFFDKEIDDFVDNGQHILASWYTNTFEFLKIIGTYERLKFQKQLEVKFADLNGNNFLFRCPDIPPPLHLIRGLWKYPALGFNDKLAVTRLVNAIVFEKLREEELKSMDTGELFNLMRQSDRVVDSFWKPFIIAVFNAEPPETSAWQFVQIIKTGFLRKGSSNLVLPGTNLNRLYVDEAEKYLLNKDSKILKQAKIAGINYSGGTIGSIQLESGLAREFDFYISAVPFFEFRNLFTEEVLNGQYNAIDNLTPSPIVNVHFEFETDIGMEDDFVGILNATIQWVFKINRRRICIVISSAKNLVNKEKNELVSICRDELNRSLPQFRDCRTIYTKVVKEKRATFLPDKASVSSRPDFRTKINNLFLAGDWINTGYPATIESAVKSSKNCVEEIIKLTS